MDNNKCILDPNRDCLGLIEARRVEKELERHKSEAQSSFTRQGERLGSLETQMAVHQANYLNIIAKLDDLISKVATLEAKPGKRWEMVLVGVLTAAGTAIVAFVLSRLGIG